MHCCAVSDRRSLHLPSECQSRVMKSIWLMTHVMPSLPLSHISASNDIHHTVTIIYASILGNEQTLVVSITAIACFQELTGMK